MDQFVPIRLLIVVSLFSLSNARRSRLFSTPFQRERRMCCLSLVHAFAALSARSLPLPLSLPPLSLSPRCLCHCVCRLRSSRVSASLSLASPSLPLCPSLSCRVESRSLRSVSYLFHASTAAAAAAASAAASAAAVVETHVLHSYSFVPASFFVFLVCNPSLPSPHFPSPPLLSLRLLLRISCRRRVASVDCTLEPITPPSLATLKQPSPRVFTRDSWPLYAYGTHHCCLLPLRIRLRRYRFGKRRNRYVYDRCTELYF